MDQHELLASVTRTGRSCSLVSPPIICEPMPVAPCYPAIVAISQCTARVALGGDESKSGRSTDSDYDINNDQEDDEQERLSSTSAFLSSSPLLGPTPATAQSSPPETPGVRRLYLPSSFLDRHLQIFRQVESVESPLLDVQCPDLRRLTRLVKLFEPYRVLRFSLHF